MRKNMYALSVIAILLASISLSNCSGGAKYEIRAGAIRAIKDTKDSVGLSIWIYAGADTIIDKSFTSGRLDSKTSGTNWVTLTGSSFAKLPAKAVANGMVSIQAKLNPNRLGTPPDAVFAVKTGLQQLFTKDPNAATFVVTSAEGEVYQLRLLFRKTGGDTESD